MNCWQPQPATRSFIGYKSDMSDVDQPDSTLDLHQRIRASADDLPRAMQALIALLLRLRGTPEYNPATDLANELVRQQIEAICIDGPVKQRLELVTYAREFFSRAQLVKTLRRLANDPSATVRRAVAKVVRGRRIREVTLTTLDTDTRDTTGWRRPRRRSTAQRPQGTARQQQQGVAVIPDLLALRTTLGIQSARQLGWMLTATDEGNGPYVRFCIAKRNGSDRVICAPKWSLKAVQQRILDRILTKIEPHAAAHGFVPGRSIRTNAAPHVGAKVILKFDLRNFFPSIHWSRVLGLFVSLGYYAGTCRLSRDDDSRNVAMALARLCTYTHDPKNWDRCHTPQGAPTSPAISNLICRRLDARLSGLATQLAGAYTRYADDLTFSFRQSSVDVGRVRWWVDQICHQEGFFVNHSKFRIIRAARRQIVTGIVVNDTLRIRREQRRRFRAILHNCRRYGIDSQRAGRSDFESYLQGFASYIHMIHPEEGRDLLKQVAHLLGESRAT